MVQILTYNLKILVDRMHVLIGIVGRNVEFRSTNDDFIFRAQGGLVEKFRISQAGNGTFTDNLTISGTLQSPLTSLIGVSINTNNVKINQLGISVSTNDTHINQLGITTQNIDGRISSLLGITSGNYLTRNEVILPPTFTQSSLNSVGTLSNLNVTGSIIGTSGKFKVLR